jgi:hypothetical protein
VTLDRSNIKRAGMALRTVVTDTGWVVPRGIELVGSDLTWPRAGAARSVQIPGTAFPFLDQFVRLAHEEEDDEADVLRFARRWGLLDICFQHGLPSSHVPDRVWRWVTVVTGEFGDDAADSYNPCRPPGLRRLREPVERWRHFAAEAQAILNIAANLHQGQRAPLPMWTPLEERVGMPAAALLGEQSAESGYTGPTPEMLKKYAGQRVQWVRPRRSTVSEQRQILNRVIQGWLENGDVRIVFRWTKRGTSIEFGSHCLFGALALQLALVVARSQGLAICTNCGRAYPPTRRPARGRNNYCELSDCGSRAAKKDWAARQARQDKD